MEIPSNFIDHAFSMEVMRDPVSTADGHTFERADIEQWIRARGTNPFTRAPLELTELTPNRALKGAIEEFLLSNQKVRGQIEWLQRQRQLLQRAAALEEDGPLSETVAAVLTKMVHLIGCGPGCAALFL